MDPLSVAASIAGLATAAGEVAKILKPYVSAASETVPPIALQVYAEVESTRTILSAVQRLINNLSLAKNTSLIQVDDVVAVLTDGVLVYSDLEEAIGELRIELPADSIPLRSRLLWAHKESKVKSLLTRLQGFKSSTSLILNLLNCESNQQAEQHRVDLTESIDKLLEGNHDLVRRMMLLEGVIGLQHKKLAGHDADPVANTLPTISEVSAARAPPASFFDFEADLESSRVYGRAKRTSMDFSFRSSKARSTVGSMLSGISLSKVSNISVIALPIFVEDVSNSHHYSFCFSLDVTCTEPYKTTGIPRGVSRSRHPLYKNEPKNPLRDLKHVCQKGTPLLALINKLRPGFYGLRRYSDPTSYGGVALHEFIADFNALNLGPTKAFTILDLTEDSYVGFFKVVETLESILEELVKRTILKKERLSEQLPSYGDAFEDVRATVASFLDTERRFFEKMRKLLSIKTKMRHELFNRKESKLVFGPIDRIVDWQVELLLAIETQVLEHPFNQRWNIPFTPLARVSKDFQVYDSSSSKRGAILSAKMARRNKNLYDPHASALQQLMALSGLPILHLDQY
uniref:Cdc24/Scd1 N-terminal domain-containing protein n=1 Tax=Bionectria ochroleuca TaxID=29856 RepID=A0A0B7KN66_BIOOC